jgi:surface protein
MSKLVVSGVGNIIVKNPPPVKAEGWVRNVSWLTMPTITEIDQKVAILIAIDDTDSNFTAFTVRGAHTVDWGDGTSPVDIADNVRAEYIYDYNAAGLEGTNAPVTLTDTGDLVTRTAHGYGNGDVVTLWNVNTTTGPVSGQQYYVINATSNTFQISLTLGGSAVTFTGDGSATLLPYKQAVIIITPQAGQNLTNVNLVVRHPSASAVNYNTRFLDLICSLPNATVFTSASNTTVINRSLERIKVISIIPTTFFRADTCSSLKVLEAPSNYAPTVATSMFRSCPSLESVPLFDTSAVLSMSQMFNGCSSLKTVPLYDTSSVTNMSSMFSACNSLESVPLFDTSAVTNMSSMFASCTSLQAVPLFNTASVTTMSSMFLSCTGLQSVPLFDTSLVNNSNSMFQSCGGLRVIPALDMSAITSDTNLTNFVTGSASLAKIEATGFAHNLTLTNCNLSGPALDQIYTNLATVVGKTITITGTYGANTDDPTIATAKGWTVTG